MESEFEIPALRSIPMERLLPGDEVWGWEDKNKNRNVQRKGWIIDREPTIVKEFVIHYEFMKNGECAWTMNRNFVGMYWHGILCLIADKRKVVKHVESSEEDFDDVTSINHDRCEDI